jgi:hypothetical protein
MSENRPSRITAEEARAWRERWRLVNEAEIEELRATPVEQKFRQLAVLMASADLFPRTPVDEAEDEAVREVWMRLRERWHA